MMFVDLLPSKRAGYFLAVLGSRPAYLASVLGMLCFNFFFLPPVYTLAIAHPQNWVALVAFLVTPLRFGR
jgi:K+-sensing histidine kinase KdpD